MEATESFVEYEENNNTVRDVLFTYSEEERQQQEVNYANAELVYSNRYLVVPMEVFNKGYSGNDALILSYIHSWKEKDGGRFFYSNERIAGMFNIAPQTVSSIISKLEKKGEIVCKRKMRAGGGQIRFIDLATSQNLKTQLKKNLSSNIRKHDGSNNRISNNRISRNIYTPTSDKLTVSSDKHTVVEHKQDTPLVKEEKQTYASIPLLIHAMFCHVFEFADDTQYMISSYKTVAKEMKHHLAGRGDITIPAMYFIILKYDMPKYEHLFSWHKENKKRPRPEQILKWWIAVKQEYVQYTPPPREEFEQMFSEIGLKMRPEDYDKPY